MAGILVSDERHERWYIAEGDPAWPLAQQLMRQGYRQIVLPYVTILTGTIPDVGYLDNALESLATVWEADAEESVSRAFEHLATMRDCCLTLQIMV